MVKTLPSNAGGAGSVPGQGARIPHALGPKNQNIKQKQYCNKFNKGFKNGPHQNIYQSISNAAKAVLRGKFIVINAYIKKQEKSQVSNLILHFEALEKQMTTKVSRGKVKTKIRAEINEIETKNTREKMNKTNSCSLKR